MTEAADILIVGGGPVGATLALALRDSGLKIAVLEARAASTPSDDPRTLALSEGSRQILQRLGIWDELAPHATPIETIHVSQRGRLGRTLLHARDEDQQALGYVLPYMALANALDRKLAATGTANVQYDARAIAVNPAESLASVRFERGADTLDTHARLVVLADGGRSLNELHGMTRKVREYGHSALVGHVECELAHRNTAYERFTPDGPVALLPEGERGYALVWTVSPTKVETLITLSAPEFLQQLHRHFGDRAGQFLSVSGRAAFPLKLATVRPVTVPHLAVIGNAAQTLHPVAGQGFNLGLRDAWELALTLRDTAPEAIGSTDMLARYRQRRQMDTGGGIFFTDFLVRAFSNDLPGLGTARGAGLTFLELLAPAKRFVARKMSFGANG
jgi:2-octaprenyl-6-methoxyphenol hydroxylase